MSTINKLIFYDIFLTFLMLFLIMLTLHLYLLYYHVNNFYHFLFHEKKLQIAIFFDIIKMNAMHSFLCHVFQLDNIQYHQF